MATFEADAAIASIIRHAEGVALLPAMAIPLMGDLIVRLVSVDSESHHRLAFLGGLPRSVKDRAERYVRGSRRALGSTAVLRDSTWREFS